MERVVTIRKMSSNKRLAALAAIAIAMSDYNKGMIDYDTAKPRHQNQGAKVYTKVFVINGIEITALNRKNAEKKFQKLLMKDAQKDYKEI